MKKCYDTKVLRYRLMSSCIGEVLYYHLAYYDIVQHYDII